MSQTMKTNYYRCNHCGRETLIEPERCPRCDRTFFVRHALTLADGETALETSSGVRIDMRTRKLREKAVDAGLAIAAAAKRARRRRDLANGWNGCVKVSAAEAATLLELEAAKGPARAKEPTMNTPQPSAEAMAVARKHYNPASEATVVALARLIDEAFAPLRREREALREGLRELAIACTGASPQYQRALDKARALLASTEGKP